VTWRLRIGGEIVEDRVNGRGDIRRSRKQAQVGVEACGCGIVIARPYVYVSSRLAVRIMAHQQSKLAVRLKAHQAVIDLHTLVFKSARPLYVGRFVKAGR